MPMSITVVIAADQPLRREGLARILATEPGIEVVGEAGSADEALAKVEELRPDVVLMDISMPGGGLMATREISQRFPDTGVIILTIHDDEQYLYELVRAGAKGYLVKDSEPRRVVEAIRHVHAGGSYLPPDLMDKVLGEFRRLQEGGGTARERPRTGAEALTARELEILQLIVEGRSNAQIAAALYISEKTVKNHITNILRKLDLHDRTQAAVFALRHGLAKRDGGPAGGPEAALGRGDGGGRPLPQSQGLPVQAEGAGEKRAVKDQVAGGHHPAVVQHRLQRQRAQGPHGEGGVH